MTDAIIVMPNENPLIRFSIYTHCQSDAVIRLGKEIITLLANTAGSEKDAMEFMRAYNLFWFWTLGAYEILRTMKQHSTCFKQPLVDKIKLLEKNIKSLRIPFTKQELKDNGGCIKGELSVCSLGAESDDMVFKIGDTNYHAKEVILEIENFFQGIQPADVIAPLPVRT